MSRFLVIGESGIDRYIYGTVSRLAPDAPVPVVNPTHETNTAGMAGNVVANLISLGASHVDSILSDPPITKTRYVDNASGYILLRVDENDRVKVPFSPTTQLPVRGEDYSAVVISDYAKGYLDETDIVEVAQWAGDFNLPVFLDTKKVLGEWSRQCIVKINRREYENQLKTRARPQDFCRELIVTLGDEGAWWVNRDVKTTVPAVSVSDLSGAGDTFLAALVTAYSVNGGNFVTAMEWANRAARVAVSKRGVVAVTRAEVEETL